MKDLGSTKLDATPEVASTNELPTKDADTAKARQEKAKHSSVAIAAALTAVGALFVTPRPALAEECNWSSSSSCDGDGGRDGGGGGGGSSGDDSTGDTSPAPPTPPRCTHSSGPSFSPGFTPS